MSIGVFKSPARCDRSVCPAKQKRLKLPFPNCLSALLLIPPVTSQEGVELLYGGCAGVGFHWLRRDQLQNLRAGFSGVLVGDIEPHNIQVQLGRLKNLR